MHVPFVIRNDGMLSLHSVTVQWYIDKMKTRHNIQMSNILIHKDSFLVPILAPNEPTTFRLRLTILNPSDVVESAEMYVLVSYKPFGLPFRGKKFRFSIEHNEAGLPVWVSQSLSQ